MSLSTDDRQHMAADFFVAGGTLAPNVPSYVKRPADDELFSLALAGEFCYVLTTRQMGKSSLMVRTARRLQAEGVRTAIIDLTTMGTSAVDAWYLGLLTELGDELDLAVDAEAWWQARASLGAEHRFTNFLRDVVLTGIADQVVIFIDEIDTTLKLAFRDDFFTAIRSMYNKRASNPEFERLTFVMLGVASPTELVGDSARTPFNIGQGIALQGFSWADAGVMRDGLERVHPGQGEAIFARIYHWTSGHPYLTQKLCLTVAEADEKNWTEERVDECVKRLFLSEEARKEGNLKFVRDKVLTHPQRRALLNHYKKVLKGREIRDEQSSIQNHLKLIGLVKTENGYLHIYNEIYRHVFDLIWTRANTPKNWTLVIASMVTFMALLAVSYAAYLRESIPTPEPLEVGAISVESGTLIPVGGTVPLTIKVSGDIVQYTWQAQRGKLTSFTTQFPLYTAPSSSGYDVITVTVTSRGDNIVRSIDLIIYDSILLTPTQPSSETPEPENALCRLEDLGIPGGWMSGAGNPIELISLDTVSDGCHTSSSCLRIIYGTAGAWGGILWWPLGCGPLGAPDGWSRVRTGVCGVNVLAVCDLDAVTHLTFWSRGEQGGEVVEFKVGGADISPFPGRSTGKIALDTHWVQYEIDLTSMDLTNANGLFLWVATDMDNPNGAIFYLDDIQFEGVK